MTQKTDLAQQIANLLDHPSNQQKANERIEASLREIEETLAFTQAEIREGTSQIAALETASTKQILAGIKALLDDMKCNGGSPSPTGPVEPEEPVVEPEPEPEPEIVIPGEAARVDISALLQESPADTGFKLFMGDVTGSYTLDFSRKFAQRKKVKVSTQKEFNLARANRAEIGVIEWVGATPVKLVDHKPDESGIEQQFICDELAWIDTIGEIVITPKKLVAPVGAAVRCNVMARGSRVVVDLAGTINTVSWPVLLWMNYRGDSIESVYTNGGVVIGDNPPGTEIVCVCGPCWINDIYPTTYQKHGPWDLRSKNCGARGSTFYNIGADCLQTVEHPDKMGKPNSPHGDIYAHVVMYGCICMIEEEKMAIHGYGEQPLDVKAGSAKMKDSVLWNYIMNRKGANGSNGDILGSHYDAHDVVVEGCVIKAQVGVEVGSGKGNRVEECLFMEPIDGYSMVIHSIMSNLPSHLNASEKLRIAEGQIKYNPGRRHALAYRGEKYGKLSNETELALVNNVFAGGPVGIPDHLSYLTQEGSVSVAKGSIVYKDLPKNTYAIGSTDERSGRWHAKV